MIAVLDYGIGNLRSAEKALQRVGADARLTTWYSMLFQLRHVAPCRITAIPSPPSTASSSSRSVSVVAILLPLLRPLEAGCHQWKTSAQPAELHLDRVGYVNCLTLRFFSIFSPEALLVRKRF